MLSVMAPLLRLYPFKFRDPATGCWTKARYKATLSDIAARHAEWMIDGEPEIRGSIPASSFSPYPRHVPLVASDVELHARPRDQLEAHLAATFLRRYVTYCARRRRFAAMQGAASLLQAVRRSSSTRIPGCSGTSTR
jgi:hypothetical protein